MPATPFSNANKEFSDKAHLAARRLIYPQMFKALPQNISYETQEEITSERGGALDGDMSIDRVVKVTVSGFRAPFTFTVQERFRKPENAKWQDITITEWNTRSNTPSELYKISANFFLYGYYDDLRMSFVDALIINVPSMMYSIATGAFRPDRRNNPRSDQPFLCLKFDDLHRAGLVMYRMQAPITRVEPNKIISIAEFAQERTQAELLDAISFLAEQLKKGSA
jgi:hypothetical protein